MYLTLTAAEIGDGFALAAFKVGKQLDKDERGFYNPDFRPEVLLQASKLFFFG